MLQQLYAIFKNTFLESIRQPIYLIMIGIGVLALVLNLNMSAFTLDDDNKFLIDMGMATIFLCALLIAAFVATSVLTLEIENRTVLTVVSKPVGRPLFILGKYLGVSAAVLVAVTVLSCTFLLTIRHGVLQNASDRVDYPVIVFGLAAVFLSVLVGTVANYLYGWVFTSTTVSALFPFSVLAYFGVLAVNKHWEFQLFGEKAVFGISPDLRPQILIAIFGLSLAVLVICSIAIAASTRLGQVMTLFTCVMVFMVGLLSDSLFGKRSYQPRVLCRIMDVRDGRDIDGDFSDDGDWYEVTLDKMVDLRKYQQEVLKIPEDAPTPIYLAADALGHSMLGKVFDTKPNPRTKKIVKGVLLRNIHGQRAEIVNVGNDVMKRKPLPGDYIHGGMPSVKLGWRIAWGIPPNLQSFLLTDAVTQRHVIPLGYMVLTTVYAGLYIFASLSLAVILFQKREVG